jgi:hypothetical protein
MKKHIFLGLLVIFLLTSGTVWANSEFTEAIVKNADPHTPAALAGGATLGQEIIATKAFNGMKLYLPTWKKSTSGCTVVVRKHGPTGKVVYKEEIRNAKDNLTTIQFATQPIGRYYVEISEAVDQIGWWTREDVYPRGVAYEKGVPVPTHDREIDIFYKPEQ